MRHFVSTVALSFLVLVSGCSASKQAYKKAKEYEDAGLYVESAEQDLKALDKKPDYKDAKKHLRVVAPKAYNELMSRAKNLESAANWDQVVAEYQHLNVLLNRCNRHGIVFETVNVKERLSLSRSKAAEFHHKNAEMLFASKDWRKAAEAYMRAHKHIDNYKQSFDKAIQAFLNAGDQALKAGRMRAAIKDFTQALEVAPNHPQAKKGLADSHFQLGKQLYAEGQFRKSLNQLEKAEEFNPDNPQIKEWADKAYDAAVQYVAVFPFVNRTRVPVDGNRIASALLTVVETKDLKFADFMSHPEAVSAMNQASHGEYGRVSETQLRRVAEQEGLDSFVWGTVQNIDVEDGPENMTEMTHERKVTVKDSTGKDVEGSETVYYREYTRNRNVRVQIEQVILATATGQILDRNRFTEEINDVARWVAYQGSIYDLPKKKRVLLDAPRSPRPVPALLDEMTAGVVEKMGRVVVKFYR